MAFDYKKEYKIFYMPKNKHSIVEIPRMNYLAVRGTGNPNLENSDYQNIKTKINYRNDKFIDLKKYEWIITENHHEPIINKDKFAEV